MTMAMAAIVLDFSDRYIIPAVLAFHRNGRAFIFVNGNFLIGL